MKLLVGESKEEEAVTKFLKPRKGAFFILLKKHFFSILSPYTLVMMKLIKGATKELPEGKQLEDLL